MQPIRTRIGTLKGFLVRWLGPDGAIRSADFPGNLAAADYTISRLREREASGLPTLAADVQRTALAGFINFGCL